MPAELSSLVGRGPQIAAVLDSLRAARVVTLTGPGGCGKTRLALRAAALAADRFEGGAWLVELASLTDPALVPGSVAEALGIPERDTANPMAAVVQALADRELLIVLDNCEHVLGPAGQVVATLAGQCCRVRVLATSRERLDVPGESVFPVPPLELPEDGSVRAVAASEAGRLFVTRARAASPAFALTAGDSAAIAEVCSRLDGMRVRFVRTEINGFDVAGQRLLTGAGPIGWGRLVLALGSRPNDFAIPGLAERTLSLYSAGDAERAGRDPPESGQRPRPGARPARRAAGRSGPGHPGRLLTAADRQGHQNPG